MDLSVTEIFYSIQGESSHAGRPCAFARLGGCNLRCAWCDTPYSWQGGTLMPVERVRAALESYACPLVEITGGEPLLQPAALELARLLADAGREVLIETNGSLPLVGIDPRVAAIMDVKCPSSAMAHTTCQENFHMLRPLDELKFVLADREDFEYATSVVRALPVPVRHIHFSPVSGRLAPELLARWILTEHLPVRLSLQLHKIIWDPALRGV
ncbi:7-carboxy-7-deazaguanine synthase QueE [Fundidesulfovibrio butyratiphilus]